MSTALCSFARKPTGIKDIKGNEIFVGDWVMADVVSAPHKAKGQKVVIDRKKAQIAEHPQFGFVMVDDWGGHEIDPSCEIITEVSND